MNDENIKQKILQHVGHMYIAAINNNINYVMDLMAEILQMQEVLMLKKESKNAIMFH